MKLTTLSLLLVGLCCVSNSYAMEKDKQDLAQKLFDANDLLKKAEVGFESEKHLLKTLEIKPTNLINQAHELVQSVLQNKQATLDEKQYADILSLQMIFFVEKAKQGKIQKADDINFY